MGMYNIIKENDRYNVEMGWQLAEMFTDFMISRGLRYNLKCGDSVYTREVEFLGR